MGGQIELEIRHNVRLVPSRPIVLGVVIFSVLALALAVLYVLNRGTQAHTNGFGGSVVTVAAPQDIDSDPYSPRDPIGQPYRDPFSPQDPSWAR